MAVPRKKMVPLNFQTAPPFRRTGPRFGKKMLNLIKTKQKMMKKTTFNRKGYVNETANVKALREMRILYYSCLANAIREAADDEEIVRLTAQACRQAGLPEEPCVQRTIGQDQLSLSADEVRKIFRAAYTAKGVKPRSVLNQKERIARGIADFFSRRYEVRYNTVKKIEEWRPRDGVYHEWQQLTDRDLNRMTFEQMSEGGDGWGIDLQLYLHSTMIPQYNPLTEFLDGCGRYYGHKDHIAELARRIPTDYADWEQLFRCWFLAMVAQWQGIDSRFSRLKKCSARAFPQVRCQPSANCRQPCHSTSRLVQSKVIAVGICVRRNSPSDAYPGVRGVRGVTCFANESR